MKYCPYCGKSTEEISRDHIFPWFLGGHHKIDSCGGKYNCNNTFGHTFEVGAGKFLQSLHVFISSWGLPLRSADPMWKAAYEQDGKHYDLSVSKNGVLPELTKTKPHIDRDDKGDIIGRAFRGAEIKEAKKFGEQLIKKGKAKAYEIIELPAPKMDLKGLQYTLEMGPDIKKLVLKMCISAATLLPQFRHTDVLNAQEYLTGNKKKSLLI